MAYDIVQEARRASTLSTPLRHGRALPPFAALKAFEAFGRLGGVRRAAAALGLDHAVVSRHLRALEAWTSSELIDRSTAGGRLTPAGERYHVQINAAIELMAGATDDLMRRHDETRLVIWCVPGFASQWLSQQLSVFGALYPHLELEVRPTDTSPDLLRNEADADIRYFGDAWAPPPEDRRLRCMELARPRIRAVASPELAASLGDLSCPEALLSAPLLHEEHDEQWRAWFIAQNVPTPERLPGARLWHAHLALASARRGEGVALASSFLLADDLEAGRLVELAAPQSPAEGIVLGGYVLVAREDRWRWPTLQRLRGWLQNAASGAVNPPT